MLYSLSDHANLHPHVSVGCWAKTVLPNRLLICAGQSQVLQSEADSRSTVLACSLQSVACLTDDTVFVLEHAAAEMFQAVLIITGLRCIGQFGCHGFVAACA